MSACERWKRRKEEREKRTLLDFEGSSGRGKYSIEIKYRNGIRKIRAGDIDVDDFEGGGYITTGCRRSKLISNGPTT